MNLFFKVIQTCYLLTCFKHVLETNRALSLCDSLMEATWLQQVLSAQNSISFVLFWFCHLFYSHMQVFWNWKLPFAQECVDLFVAFAFLFVYLFHNCVKLVFKIFANIEEIAVCVCVRAHFPGAFTSRPSVRCVQHRNGITLRYHLPHQLRIKILLRTFPVYPKPFTIFVRYIRYFFGHKVRAENVPVLKFNLRSQHTHLKQMTRLKFKSQIHIYKKTSKNKLRIPKVTCKYWIFIMNHN
jgi:hypothetical protein